MGAAAELQSISLASLRGRAELPVALSGSRAAQIWLLSCCFRLSYLICRIPSVDSDPGGFSWLCTVKSASLTSLLPLPCETFTDKHHPGMTAWHRGRMCHCTHSHFNVFESGTAALVPLGTRKSEIWEEDTLLDNAHETPGKAHTKHCSTRNRNNNNNHKSYL